jgi:hypothetical protein
MNRPLSLRAKRSNLTDVMLQERRDCRVATLLAMTDEKEVQEIFLRRGLRGVPYF